MNCQEAKPLIDPYADGELEAAAILELEQHLQSCSACGIAWRNLQSLKKTLKLDELYFTAPEELRRRIKSELPSPAKEVPRTTRLLTVSFAVFLCVGGNVMLAYCTGREPRCRVPAP